ncbi:MFS transporter [Micromonospora sp. NPDC093277]|uniref:MFS transporter n=1 Tax=Micromonospora sp. NPDC093277 TaxID=3364291 RepID=UPI0038211076
MARVAPRNPWTIFWVLALIEFISVIDASAVHVALPSISAGLGFSSTTIAWVVDAYIVGFAGFMLLAGRATDVVGRRRLFIVGVVLFAAFSLACALSVTPWQLVASRLFQGLGAALVTPAALALITDIFPEGAGRNRALGIFSGMAGLAAPVGLVLGGLLTSAAWQWIFLINLPICLGVLLAAPRLLPRSGRLHQVRLDLVGAVAVTSGLVLLILAVLRGSAQRWTSGLTLGEFVLSAALLLVFVLRQLRGPAPLLPTELFARRNVAVGNLIFPLVGAVLISTLFFVALFLQQVRGYRPIEAAFITLPIPLAMLAGTQTAPRVLRCGPPNVLAAGLLIQAMALGLWAAVISDSRSIAVAFALPAAIWAFGVGMSIVSSFVVCTTGVTGAVAGAASGLATTTYQAGGALGLAVLAVVADSRTAAVTGRMDGTDAVVSGYAWALSCALAATLFGAVLTRLIVARTTAATASTSG